MISSARKSSLALHALLWAASLVAQQVPSWTLTTTPTSPPTRGGAVFVFDALRGECVLFGGRPDTGYYGDTWTYDGSDWAQRAPATAPSARYNGAAAYDSGRGRVVLFGGTDDMAVFGDTWEWDGATWTQRALTPAPSARESASLVYDPIAQVMVLYGGSTFAGPMADTWIYDGTAWTSVPSGPTIGARFGHAAYSGRAGRVQFVGLSPGSLTSEGFEWHGSSGWVRQPTLDVSGTPPRLLRDSGRALLVDPHPRPRVHDGVAWTTEAPAFEPAIGQNFAYDDVRQAIVAFGWWQTRGHLVEGFTWEYRVAPATGFATAQEFGNGCAAPGVQPRYLTGVTAAPPRLGSTTVVRSYSRDTSASYLVLGSSRMTLANGTALPVTHPLFRSGCTLQVRPDDALLLVRPVSTYAEAALAIPNTASLLGAVLYAQEVMAPTWDMFLSNGLELRAGY